MRALPGRHPNPGLLDTPWGQPNLDPALPGAAVHPGHGIRGHWGQHGRGWRPHREWVPRYWREW